MKIDLKGFLQEKLTEGQDALNESTEKTILDASITFYLTHLFVVLYGFSYHKDFEKLKEHLEGLPKAMDGEFRKGLTEVFKSSILSELSDGEKKEMETDPFINAVMKNYSKNADEIIGSFCQSLNIAISKVKGANK